MIRLARIILFLRLSLSLFRACHTVSFGLPRARSFSTRPRAKRPPLYIIRFRSAYPALLPCFPIRP